MKAPTLLSPAAVLWGRSAERSPWITSFQGYNHPVKYILGFPGGSDNKESACNAGDPEFDPWVGKIPWRRE